MTKCPVEDCEEMNSLKRMLGRTVNYVIMVGIIVGCAAVWTWARSLAVPDIQTDMKVLSEHVSTNKMDITVNRTMLSSIKEDTDAILKKLEREERRRERESNSNQ